MYVIYLSRNTLYLSTDQVSVDSAPIQCLFYPSLSLFHWVGVWARDREVPVRIMSNVMRWGGGGTKEGGNLECWLAQCAGINENVSQERSDTDDYLLYM